MYESRRHTRPAPSSGRPWTSMAHILPDAWRMRRLPDSCSATIAWTTECPTVLARIGMSTLTAPVDSLLRSGDERLSLRKTRDPSSLPRESQSATWCGALDRAPRRLDGVCERYMVVCG